MPQKPLADFFRDIIGDVLSLPICPADRAPNRAEFIDTLAPIGYGGQPVCTPTWNLLAIWRLTAKGGTWASKTSSMLANELFAGCKRGGNRPA
jgi:hypothetical protein